LAIKHAILIADASSSCSMCIQDQGRALQIHPRNISRAKVCMNAMESSSKSSLESSFQMDAFSSKNKDLMSYLSALRQQSHYGGQGKLKTIQLLKKWFA